MLHESKWESNKTASSAFTGIDNTSKMNWQVSNDNENLYLRLSTAKRTTIMKMIRKGFKVYFNIVDDKKKSETYLNFPLEMKRQAGEDRRAMAGQFGGGGMRRGGGRQGGQNRTFDVQRIIKRIPRNVIYQQNGKQETFVMGLDQTNIKVDLAASADGKLYYEAVIPFEKIIVGGIKNLRNLSIGLVSGSFDIPVNSSRGPAGMGGAGRPGGMTGRMGGNMSDMADPVKIWFKVKPAVQ